MRTIGTPAEWVGLIDSFVPDILELVMTTWETMPPLTPNAKEDQTTNDFCLRLKQSPRRSDLPFQIRPQVVELEPAGDEDLGRMDIVFLLLVPREDMYFCLECKRLNVVKDGTPRTFTSEYVTKGMLRFVRGQYAKAVRNGGMLGYVLDGNVAGAIANIESNIRRHHEHLGMNPPGQFMASSIRPADTRVRETHHHRSHNPEVFHIHHLFMANPQPTPLV